VEPLAIVGYTVDGLRVGDLVGEPEGVSVGDLVGTLEGVKVGMSVGEIVGHAVLGAPVSPARTVGYGVDGATVGELVGNVVGVSVGTILGLKVGVTDTGLLGEIVGHAVLGTPVWLEPFPNVGYPVVGTRVGYPVGEPEGVAVGALLGTWLGVVVGESVGAIVGHAELGTPVWLEPLANVGYAVVGARVGEPVGAAVALLGT
jgi:hypothetical protein